jgi:ketosteroid isomerase-like protein
MKNGDLVSRLWQLMSDLQFSELDQVLAEEIVCEWPLTRERIRGRDRYIGINESYPGKWKIQVEELFESGDQVVTRCRLESDGHIIYAISFFTVQQGRITHEVDWWPEPYDPPFGRDAWTERMEDNEIPISQRGEAKDGPPAIHPGTDFLNRLEGCAW